jgi:hypothetical protein
MWQGSVASYVFVRIAAVDIFKAHAAGPHVGVNGGSQSAPIVRTLNSKFPIAILNVAILTSLPLPRINRIIQFAVPLMAYSDDRFSSLKTRRKSEK